MPLYQYKCQQKDCGHISEYLRNNHDRADVAPCSKCGSNNTFRLLSKPLRAINTEKPDKYRGKSVRVGINDELKKRSHEHFVKNEMDDLIQKYGVKHAKDVGWIDRKTGKKRKLIDEK